MVNVASGVAVETDKEARLHRERAFHDERFTEETRLAQAKYYAAVRPAFARYESLRQAYAVDADVLEYGCAKGEVSIGLAPIARSVSGIDISQVAIDQAAEKADQKGLSNTNFAVMDAEAMDFDDEHFDLIFGSGILHHLNIEKSYAELHRVLKPGGRVVFIEPLGHNPVLNFYRMMTPKARTEDEHPLRKADIKKFNDVFDGTHTQHYGLTTLGMTPFRNGPLANPLLRVTSLMDQAIFAIPYTKWWAWFCVMEGRKGH